MRSSMGMGGGNMLKAMGRAVGAGVGGVKEPIAAAAGASGRQGKPPPMVMCLASPGPSSPVSSPTFSAASGWVAGCGSSAMLVDGEEWEKVEEEEEEEEELEEEGELGLLGLSERYVFGRPPSKDEVEDAVSNLRQIIVPLTFCEMTEDRHPTFLNQGAVDKEIISAAATQKSTSVESSADSESDWMEPAWHLYSSDTFQSKECETVMDAFRLLQINPYIQRMVVSLSSDNTVWEAVMKNEVVQELRKSFHEVGNYKSRSLDEHPNAAIGIVRCILDGTKSKVMKFIDKIMKLVSGLFRSQEKNEQPDAFNDALRSSFLLSVVVFIIVVVSRIQKA